MNGASDFFSCKRLKGLHKEEVHYIQGLIFDDCIEKQISCILGKLIYLPGLLIKDGLWKCLTLLPLPL